MDRSQSHVRVTARDRLAVACLAAAVAAAVVNGEHSTAAPVRAVAQPAAQAPSPALGSLPVTAEHRYRIAGKIRPLLLFWIGKDGVGGARVRWRHGDNDARGYDLLIGSDPARAPRGVNRWGFILEEVRGPEATIVGVMKKSDEESLDEVKANEARGGIVFKMIQATVNQSESVARVTATTVPRDYSYKELDALVDALRKEPASPKVRKIPVPPGGRPGMLTAIAELLHDGAESVKRTGKAPGKKSLPWAYYTKQYDIARTSSEVQNHVTYGGVAYPKLLKSEFEVKARGESWTESFSIVFGIDGALAEVPVFMTYQPRWWLKIELMLDEHEGF
jgi:hypothetical protein